jgi:hypothetical protein
MCIDENGHQHEFSVPPPLIRSDLIAALRAEAENNLPPALNDCLRAIDQPFFTPIYDFIAPRIVSGRVALVGDAASNPRPHMGFGVSKAGCDAQALADALRDVDDIDRGLAENNRIRQPTGVIIVKHSQKLGTHMGVNLQTEEEHSMHELFAGSPRYDGLDCGSKFLGRLPMNRDLPKPDHARNMLLIEYSDQNSFAVRGLILERRKIAREDWLLEELFRIVMPELAHLRIALDCGVDELAVPLFNLADIHGESEIAVIVELHRLTRRTCEQHVLDRGDQFLRIGVAAGRLERRL